MKGGNINRIRGKHFLILLSVICMTILLWSYERKSFITTLFSSQDQLGLATSDVFPVASYISKDLVKLEDQPVQESPPAHEETEDKTKPRMVNVENTKPVAKQSSQSEEDQQFSHVREEAEDKTKLQRTNVENAEPVVKLSSISEEEEQHSHTLEETENRTKPQVANVENAKPLDRQFSVLKKDDSNATSSSEKKVCNYAKGRWVVDHKRPLYSGFKCKQWLSAMWACRLTQRPDFGYEAYRWQPDNCDMLEVESSAFLKRMQDKTIAFVGDSLGRQQFQSLMCMVTGGEKSPEVHNVGRKYGLVAHRGAARPDGWAFRFLETNTTILYYWSSCLCDLEPLNASDPSSEVAMHLDRPPSFLKRFLPHFDVLILNTGHHWNRGKLRANRWVMYVDGKPNKDRRLAMIGNAKNFTIFSVVRWLDSQLPSHTRLKAFFRTLSPRHFFNGEWNSGGSCENTTPLVRGSEVTQDESSDPVTASAVRGTKVNLLDITALSQLRDEGHISRYSIKASPGVQDCLHWCLPGIPDTWNEILAAQL